MHIPVMLKEVLGHLKAAALESHRHIFADLTFGGGGHTLALLKALEKSFVVAFDQDGRAIDHGEALLKKKGLTAHCVLHHDNFKNLAAKAPNNLAGIVADLGVSSHQLDCASRGFSFRKNGPLDMRMAQDSALNTAAQLLRQWSQKELEEVLRSYGEELFARRIAKAIKTTPPKTTKELEAIVFHSYPKKMRYGRLHPATKTFQALRIAVNCELTILEGAIPEMIDQLAVGGRLVVISFHSLEDRLVKRAFQKAGREGHQCLSKRPERPEKKEIDENFRSRSAKLRVVKKKAL